MGAVSVRRRLAEGAGEAAAAGAVTGAGTAAGAGAGTGKYTGTTTGAATDGDGITAVGEAVKDRADEVACMEVADDKWAGSG